MYMYLNFSAFLTAISMINIMEHFDMTKTFSVTAIILFTACTNPSEASAPGQPLIVH